MQDVSNHNPLNTSLSQQAQMIYNAFSILCVILNKLLTKWLSTVYIDLYSCDYDTLRRRIFLSK